MSQCPLVPIEFDVFLKLSLLSLVSVLPHFAKLPKTFDDLKQKLQASVGVDPQSKVPYYSSEAKRLQEYDVGKRLRLLLLFFCSSTACVLWYAVARSIGAPTDAAWYECAVAAATFLGLAPVPASVVVAAEVLLTLGRLYSKASRVS